MTGRLGDFRRRKLFPLIWQFRKEPAFHRRWQHHEAVKCDAPKLRRGKMSPVAVRRKRRKVALYFRHLRFRPASSFRPAMLGWARGEGL